MTLETLQAHILGHWRGQSPPTWSYTSTQVPSTISKRPLLKVQAGLEGRGKDAESEPTLAFLAPGMKSGLLAGPKTHYCAQGPRANLLQFLTRDQLGRHTPRPACCMAEPA